MMVAGAERAFVVAGLVLVGKRSGHGHGLELEIRQTGAWRLSPVTGFYDVRAKGGGCCCWKVSPDTQMTVFREDTETYQMREKNK